MSFLWLWRGMPTLEERSATFGSSRQLFQKDLPHDLVEGRTRAERRLNDGEQFLSVVSEEALRLGCVKLREGDDDIRVVWVERLHDERLPLAAHLEEDVQLDYAPQPRCIRGTRENKQYSAARQEDWQHNKGLVDTALVYARLSHRES